MSHNQFRYFFLFYLNIHPPFPPLRNLSLDPARTQEGRNALGSVGAPLASVRLRTCHKHKHRIKSITFNVTDPQWSVLEPLCRHLKWGLKLNCGVEGGVPGSLRGWGREDGGGGGGVVGCNICCVRSVQDSAVIVKHWGEMHPPRASVLMCLALHWTLCIPAFRSTTL